MQDNFIMGWFNGSHQNINQSPSHSSQSQRHNVSVIITRKNRTWVVRWSAQRDRSRSHAPLSTWSRRLLDLARRLHGFSGQVWQLTFLRISAHFPRAENFTFGNTNLRCFNSTPIQHQNVGYLLGVYAEAKKKKNCCDRRHIDTTTQGEHNKFVARHTAYVNGQRKSIFFDSPVTRIYNPYFLALEKLLIKLQNDSYINHQLIQWNHLVKLEYKI